MPVSSPSSSTIRMTISQSLQLFPTHARAQQCENSSFPRRSLTYQTARKKKKTFYRCCFLSCVSPAWAADSLGMLFIKYVKSEGNYGFFILHTPARERASGWMGGREKKSKWIDNFITSHSHVNRSNQWMECAMRMSKLLCLCSTPRNPFRPEIPTRKGFHRHCFTLSLFWVHQLKAFLQHIQQSGERKKFARLCAFPCFSCAFFHPHHEISTKQKLLIHISLARTFASIRCACHGRQSC